MKKKAIPREIRKMTDYFSHLLARFCLIMGCECIGLRRSIGNWHFEMCLESKRLHCFPQFKSSEYNGIWTHLEGLDYFFFFLERNCKFFARARTYFAITTRMFPPQSVSCHCTDPRNCELNKVLHHFTINRLAAQLCDTVVIFPVWWLCSGPWALLKASLHPVLWYWLLPFLWAHSASCSTLKIHNPFLATCAYTGVTTQVS